MVIGLVETDPLEEEIAKEDLLKYLPGSEVIVASSVSDFLFRADEFRRADIVVTERYLSLMQPGTSQEDFDARRTDLTKGFPEVSLARWEAREAGWVLARWMRRNGFNTPILFYMHSLQESIPVDLRSDKKVGYCRKQIEPEKLSRAVRKAIAL